jgi:DNA primase
MGVGGLKLMPFELVLAAVVNHPELLDRHCESLALLHFPAGQLDKLKAAIIDHAARSPRLESRELQNHLRGIGFSAALDGLMARTGSNRDIRPAAELADAERTLLHVMGVLREHNEVRDEIGEAALRLQQSLDEGAPGTEEDWERLRSRQIELLEGESRRNDLDRDGPLGISSSGLPRAEP